MLKTRGSVFGHFLYSRNLSVRLKPKSSFFTQSKRALSIQLFSTENSDWLIQSKKSSCSTGSSRRKTQSKKFYMCFLNRSHRLSHYQARTHTATYPYIPGITLQYHTRRWRWRGYHCCCCCFSQQVSVVHSLFPSPAACITRRQQRAVSIPCCQQRFRLL